MCAIGWNHQNKMEKSQATLKWMGLVLLFLSFIYNSPELAGVFFSHIQTTKKRTFYAQKSSCPGLLWDVVIGIRSKIKRRATMPHVGGSIINHARVTKQRKVEKPLVRISICIDTNHPTLAVAVIATFLLWIFVLHWFLSTPLSCFAHRSLPTCKFLSLRVGCARTYQFLIIHFDDGGAGGLFHSLFSVSFSGSFSIHYISTNLCSRCMVRYFSHFHQPK